MSYLLLCFAVLCILLKANLWEDRYVHKIVRLMTTSQIISLLVLILALGGSMLYYTFQYVPITQSGSECVEATTALPLVNTTTGMGMTAAINKCE